MTKKERKERNEERKKENNNLRWGSFRSRPTAKVIHKKFTKNILSGEDKRVRHCPGKRNA